ncbi:transmembrane protein 109 [Lampris incognitus]|uniref:transmembrane protein 109 n=1 Tax=Lampris incognitus TaxID=2546036 RepID=UPI0024B60419|nr:transmembrane protein 109 [Lampris incognitus]
MWLLGRGRWSALCALVVCVSGEDVFEQPAGMIRSLGTVLLGLAEEGGSYLGKLAEERAVVSVRKAFSQALSVLARGMASGLDVLFQYLTHFLQAAGINATLPVDRVTPEGVLFVVQWLFLALIGYLLISLCLRLLVSTLRRALWLLKLGLAVVAFGLILSNPDASTETTAVCLAVLVFMCVLLGVGPSWGNAADNRTSHLEGQVKTLERRIKEMERWQSTEE